jgi:hypothetical protein
LQSGKWILAAASGLMIGIAFLMKQQGVFMMVFGGATLLLLGLLMPAYPRRKLPLAVAAYSLAAVLPYGVICLWLWKAGVWVKFWFWTVTYASKYVENEPLSAAPIYFWFTFSGILRALWPLWTLAVVGGIGLFLRPSKPGVCIFVPLYFLFSFLCVCPGFYFRQHYFIVLLPCVAMLAGLGCRALWDLASMKFALPSADVASQPAVGRQKRSQATGQQSRASQAPAPVANGFGPLTSLAVIVMAAAVGGTVWMERDFFFVWRPLDACVRTYMSNPFVEAPQIAEYLKAHTTPDDTIAVIGSEPEIFFDAGRRSATGYIYTYGLVEVQPLAAQMQKEMAAEIEAAKPKYVVFANVRCSWLTVPQSQTAICDWALSYINRNYEVVGAYDLASPLKSDVYWDALLRSFPRSAPGKLDAVWPGQHGIFEAIMKEPKSLEMVLKYAAEKHASFDTVVGERKVWDVLNSDLDVGWKLTLYPGAPDTYKFCTLPYLIICRRK